jgi:hypothetical protein
VDASFDPMIYDIMRETANELRGEYIWLSRNAATAEDRTRFAEANLELSHESQQVNSRDLDAVQSKTAEYRSRLQQLRAAA